MHHISRLPTPIRAASSSSSMSVPPGNAAGAVANKPKSKGRGAAEKAEEQRVKREEKDAERSRKQAEKEQQRLQKLRDNNRKAAAKSFAKAEKAKGAAAKASAKAAAKAAAKFVKAKAKVSPTVRVQGGAEVRPRAANDWVGGSNAGTSGVTWVLPDGSRKRTTPELSSQATSQPGCFGEGDSALCGEEDEEAFKLEGSAAARASEALGGQSEVARDKAAWVAAQIGGGLQKKRVVGALKLLEEGNTVPFIARYRKELTGSMDEEVLRTVERVLQRADALESRRLAVALALHKQGALSEDLRTALLGASASEEVEDIWAPFKQKRQTRGQLAKARGLAPLASLLERLGGKRRFEAPATVAEEYINAGAGVATPAEALAGARDIIAEQRAQNAEVKQWARAKLERSAMLTSKRKSATADDGGHFKTYWNFSVWMPHAKPHQFLAIQRGEAAKALTVGFALDDAGDKFLDQLVAWAPRAADGNRGASSDAWAQEWRSAVTDAFKRLIKPSLEREWRRRLKEQAEDDAFNTYRQNLSTKFLTPPLRLHPDWGSDSANPVCAVLGIDPAYRTGCKLALIDATGQVLETSTVYPHAAWQGAPVDPSQAQAASQELARLVELGLGAKSVDEPPAKRRRLDGRLLCSVGNATASRETEAWLRLLLGAGNTFCAGSASRVGYCIVDEAGASVYSASPLARKEFPDMDVTLRGAVSIARRLQDPLAELVKIDPKSIGVGLYQHDVDQKRLAKELAAAVEDCVNAVGADLNTSSPSLLERVAGLSGPMAQAIVARRESQGPFTNRQQLLKVKGIGARVFQQAAGFLRIFDGEEPLDATSVHPESYTAARALGRCGGHGGDAALAGQLGVGAETLADIEVALVGAVDPRSGQPPPRIKAPGATAAVSASGALDAQEAGITVESLTIGMRLQGVVRNVVAFGAFVDVGIGHDGLLHVSQFKDTLRVNDRIDVSVAKAESAPGKGGGRGGRGGGKVRWRIGLSMCS